MKKILTLFTALILLGSMTVVQADYYVAGTMTGWSASDANYKMSGTGPYTVTKQLSSGNYQFKITNGSWDQSWATFDNSASDVTLSQVEGNIAFTLSTTSDVTFYFNGSTSYLKVVAVSVPSFTFTAGTTIYYDFTGWGNGGINSYVCGNEAWHGSTGNIIGVELASNWEVTTSTKLWRCNASGSWADYYCTTLPEEGQNMIVSTDGMNFTWGTYSGGALPPATIKLHGPFASSTWADTEEFTLAANEETSSLTININKDDYEFGVKINDTWTSNGTQFTRANPSAAITAGSGNCTFAADRTGEYTFTWTYATNTLSITYPAIPAQSVTLTSIASPMLKGTAVNFAATSSGIDNPGYRFYVKEKNGSYGSAVSSYTFNTVGEFTVKVEALENNTGDPVDDDEQDVVVYDAHTFTNGTTIYVDFTNVPSGGVNYPLAGSKGIAYDDSGAGSRKTITFSDDVEWTTNDVFIKTEIGSWAELMFTVPGVGENCAVVAADGASYSWTTYAPPPATVMMNGNFADGSTMDNTAAFDLASGNATTSLTLTLAAGDYDFTMLVGGETLGNGHTFHRDYTGASISGSSAMKLEADVAGDYTFTWTYATSALSITFPAEPTPEYVTVKFFAPRDETNKWEHVYAFSWQKSRVFSDPFPGTEITSSKSGIW